MKASFIIGWGLVLLLAGCATPSAPAQLQTGLLDFLQDGATSKEEVVLKLGQPSGQLQGERILTYRVAGNARKGYGIVAGTLSPRNPFWAAWNDSKSSLVLVFDERNILCRHSLVKVK